MTWLLTPLKWFIQIIFESIFKNAVSNYNKYLEKKRQEEINKQNMKLLHEAIARGDLNEISEKAENLLNGVAASSSR